MAMLKNFYPRSRFLTPIPSHQLQASPLLQSRPVSPLLQSRPASPLSQSFQEGATSSNQQKWLMVSAEAESFGLQRKLKFYGKSGAQNVQKLKVHPPCRREKYGNRFLMSLKLPAGGRIYHKSSRSPWNNLKNESPTWNTYIVKSGQEWTVLEKNALRKLWEPSNFFTLWMKSSDRGMELILLWWPSSQLQ